MYAIALIRYRKPLEEVLKVTDEHRAFEPRHGGALLLRVPDDGGDTALDAVRDGDPFTRRGIAQYELIRWAPTIGKDDLEKL